MQFQAQSKRPCKSIRVFVAIMNYACININRKQQNTICANMIYVKRICTKGMQ
ncbi:hypothetical protein CGSMWGv00703Bmash_05302 [Gardnerella pickettii 00703Bmash]|nr:hypothetical protein CGSMWGv00703Bmash_05302 [Gardnerella pickettii 00703Bmash]